MFSLFLFLSVKCGISCLMTKKNGQQSQKLEFNRRGYYFVGLNMCQTELINKQQKKRSSQVLLTSHQKLNYSRPGRYRDENQNITQSYPLIT